MSLLLLFASTKEQQGPPIVQEARSSLSRGRVWWAPAPRGRRISIGILWSKVVDARSLGLVMALQASRLRKSSGDDQGEGGPPVSPKRGRCIYFMGYLYAPTGRTAHYLPRVKRPRLVRPFIEE